SGGSSVLPHRPLTAPAVRASRKRTWLCGDRGIFPLSCRARSSFGRCRLDGLQRSAPGLGERARPEVSDPSPVSAPLARVEARQAQRREAAARRRRRRRRRLIAAPFLALLLWAIVLRVERSEGVASDAADGPDGMLILLTRWTLPASQPATAAPMGSGPDFVSGTPRLRRPTRSQDRSR